MGRIYQQYDEWKIYILDVYKQESGKVSCKQDADQQSSSTIVRHTEAFEVYEFLNLKGKGCNRGAWNDGIWVQNIFEKHSIEVCR